MLSILQDDLVISIPFEWWFNEQDPGYFHQPLTLWLTPFDFSHVNTLPNISHVYNHFNLTNSTDELGFLEPTFVDLWNITLDNTMQCIDVNGTYGYFDDGLRNCSRCATPRDEVGRCQSTALYLTKNQSCI